MKLSASINFFDGEELLWQTVVNIRPLVEHLSIVYQQVSNCGNKISPEAEKVIDRLISSGLIDDFYCYKPDVGHTAAENEFQKRRIGLDLAIANQATHFLTMNADEFYVSEQFIKAKNRIEKEDITHSCVHSYFYIHKSTYRSEIPDTTNICFITKIDSNLVFNNQGVFPIGFVDPTRRLTNTQGMFHFFDVNEICMHHMAFVRKDFSSRLSNSSSASDLPFISQARNAIENWRFPFLFNFPNKPVYKVIEVEDIFGLSKVQYHYEKDNVKTKTVLVASSRLDYFAGSEINVLELAHAFSNLGFEVHVCAVTLANPMLDELRQLKIKLLYVEDIPNDSVYDYVWIQHWPIYNLLVLEKSIVANRIIFSSLAPIEPLECPPLLSEYMDCLLANSQENQNWIFENTPEYKNIAQVFVNSAPEEFFANQINSIGTSQSIKKIVIVSNHVPEELLEASGILKRLYDIQVEIYGIGHKTLRLTPELLAQYDAVITIGKTVQYALVMGIPVYCYDHFGGPGWINEANFDPALFHNFSGRCSKKKSTQEIINEISKGVTVSSEETRQVYNKSRALFSLTNNLKGLLDFLMADSFVKPNVKLSNTSINNISKRQNQANVRSLVESKTLMEYVVHTRDLSHDNRELKQYIQVADEKLIEQGSYIQKSDEKLIEQGSYIQKSDAKAAVFEAQIKALNNELVDRERHIKKLDESIIEQQYRINNLLSNINTLVESTSWRITHPLRWIVSIVPNKISFFVRRVFKAIWWSVTPWKIAARIKFIKQRNQLINIQKLNMEQQKIMDIVNQTDVEKDSQIFHLQQILADKDKTISELYGSRSWRLTKPLRISGRIVRQMLYPFKLAVSAVRHHGGLISTLKKVKRVYVNQGVSGVWKSLRVVFYGSNTGNYQALAIDSKIPIDIAREIFHEQQTEFTHDDLRNKIELLSHKPLISILMPVYKTPVKWLIRAIESLQDQVYENWELCVVDDCSPTDEQRNILKNFSKKDSRIKPHFSKKNQGISAASNIALEMASGEYIALVDHDDEITPDALYWIAKVINEKTDVDFIYTDECKVDDTPFKNLFDFIFKPKWSPELMFNCMLTGHLTVYKTEVVKNIGGFRSLFDFSQDYDLALRVSEIAKNIVHIERVLYLWRAIPESAATGGKSFARESNIAALNDFLKRRHISATALPLPHANYVAVNAPDDVKVSIVIPSDSYDNLKLVMTSIIEKTDFSNYEIVAVCNSVLADELSDEFSDSNKYIFSRYDKKYNFSDKCNQGARDASGEIIVFYNDDVFPIEHNWLTKLIEYLYIPGVGASSPKLLHKDGTIQYAGMISGTPGLCGTAYNGIPSDANDNFLTLHKYLRNISILSGACCALRKKIFLEIGGFDAVNTPDGHSDVDLSYKLLEAGYRCVYTPYSLLYHIGNHSWGYKKDKYKADIFCLKRWGYYISQDDYFTDTMKRVLYRDFQFTYKIHASHIDSSASYSSKDVLFVSHELSLTGAPRMLFYAAQAVKLNGGFPVVVSPQDGPIRKELEDIGVVVIIDESITANHFLFEGFARNFDVVIVNSVVLYPVVKQLSNINDLKIIWWLHEAQSLSYYLKQYNDIDMEYIQILCTSAYSQSFIPESYKSHVLHNGVPKIEKNNIQIVQKDSSFFSFILVGTIEPRKGQDILVNAILSLPDNIRQSCKFVISGKLTEPNKPFWVEVMKNAGSIPEITYTGLLTHDKLLDEVADADMLICCSRDEPFPLSTIEAAMLSKATILNEKVGTAALFKHKESCLMFDSEDSESLALQMIYAFEHRENVRQMGKAAKEIYDKNLTIEKFSENFLNYIV